MHKVNEMVFSINAYETADDMWQDITQFIRLLIKNEYIMTIRDDDVDVIVIEYEHNELIEYWGVVNPYWLSEEEVDSIKSNNNDPEKTPY